MIEYRAYNPEEIENMRTAIRGLYIYDNELRKTMSEFEISSVVEQMMQTYLVAGITCDQLQKLYYNKITAETKKVKDEPIV